MTVVTFQLSSIPRQSLIDIQRIAVSVTAPCALGLESLGSLAAVTLTSIISPWAERQIIQPAIRRDFAIELAISKW